MVSTGHLATVVGNVRGVLGGDFLQNSGMKAPLTLEQIHPEGGTLAFLIRFHGHQILAFRGMNYIEREIVGLEPDVALIGAGVSRKEIYDYNGRLMRGLHYPAKVLPTHLGRLSGTI